MVSTSDSTINLNCGSLDTAGWRPRKAKRWWELTRLRVDSCSIAVVGRRPRTLFAFFAVYSFVQGVPTRCHDVSRVPLGRVLWPRTNILECGMVWDLTLCLAEQACVKDQTSGAVCFSWSHYIPRCISWPNALGCSFSVLKVMGTLCCCCAWNQQKVELLECSRPKQHTSYRVGHHHHWRNDADLGDRLSSPSDNLLVPCQLWLQQSCAGLDPSYWANFAVMNQWTMVQRLQPPLMMV